MNKCYRIVWNIARNMFIVVSERFVAITGYEPPLPGCFYQPSAS